MTSRSVPQGSGMAQVWRAGATKLRSLRGNVGSGVVGGHPVGARNPVVAGQAAFRYSLTRPPQRVARTIRSCCPVGVRRLRRRWGSLIERAVGPVSVVMVDVVDHEPLELALVPDDRAVKEFSRRRVPIQRSAKALAMGARTGVLRILKPSVRKTSSKSPVNWLARSRTRARLW